MNTRTEGDTQNLLNEGVIKKKINDHLLNSSVERILKYIWLESTGHHPSILQMLALPNGSSFTLY